MNQISGSLFFVVRFYERGLRVYERFSGFMSNRTNETGLSRKSVKTNFPDSPFMFVV